MTDNHIHVCTQCGARWEHAENKAATSAQWQAAHTCPEGHLATVKFEPATAEGLVQVCKAGGDAMAWLKEHDPIGAVTLELERDKELGEAVDEFQNGRPIYSFPLTLRQRLCAYAGRVQKAMEARCV